METSSLGCCIRRYAFLCVFCCTWLNTERVIILRQVFYHRGVVIIASFEESQIRVVYLFVYLVFLLIHAQILALIACVRLDVEKLLAMGY